MAIGQVIREKDSQGCERPFSYGFGSYKRFANIVVVVISPLNS